MPPDDLASPGSVLGRADLHIHSSTGDGLNTVEEILEHAERHTDLDLIAITDHDEIDGALEAERMASQRGYRCQVIPGTEITTRHGHVLALWVHERFAALRTLEETVEAVRAAGGLCIVPHPLSWLTLSVGRRRLLQVQTRPERHLHFDGLEVFNPTFAGRVACQRAVQLNRRVLGLAETGGSDAHSCALIGTGVTRFPGHSAGDLRAALLARQTTGGGTYWTTADHLGGAAEQLGRAWFVHPYRKLARAVGEGRRD